MKRIQLFLLLIFLSLSATTSPLTSEFTISEISDRTGLPVVIPDTVKSDHSAGNTADLHSVEPHDGEHAEEAHAGDMTPLLFVIIALVIGASTRHWLRRSPLPIHSLPACNWTYTRGDEPAWVVR
jgi:hypothetical protein